MEVKQCASVGAEKWNERQGRGMFPPYLRTWTQTAKWSTRKRRSYVSSSSGVTDKPKGECKEKKRMSGRSQAPEGNGRSSERHLCLHKDVRVVTDEGKANEAMAGCNGNPVKQWHEDKHSQSLIACVHTEEDSESGTARNGSTGAKQSIAPCWKSSGRGLEAEVRAFALTDKTRRTKRHQIIVIKIKLAENNKKSSICCKNTKNLCTFASEICGFPQKSDVK